MIVPSNKLLLWVALLLPFVAMVGFAPAMTNATLFAAIVLTAIVLGDALAGREATRHIVVSTPETVRMSKDREGEISVRVTMNEGWHRRVTVGLPLPAGIHSNNEVVEVNMPEQSKVASFLWKCVPKTRGCFRMDKCFFEVPSPLGFWSTRSFSSIRSELKVYPNLFTERKQLAAIFLNRGAFGIHAQRMIGQGRDFEKLREYVPGDSFDDIHWKATAKRGKPITKLYQIERTQEIYVAVDSSRLSGRQAGPDAVLEKFMTSALVLGLVAQQQGDLFGLITFSDKVNKFIRAAGGKAHYNACRDALYTINSDTKTPDFEELCSFARLNLRRRALIVILTDLEDPMLSESFAKNVELICRKHVVLVASIRQPGTERLFSSASADSLDSLYRKLSGHMRWSNLRELQKSLQRHGVKLSLVDNEKLSTEIVSQYMGIKARQLL